MNFKQIIIGVCIVAVAIIVTISILGRDNTTLSLGSIQDGQAYNATTTGSFSAASSTMIKKGQGTLGSVVIGVTTATVFRLMDATSTTDIASTTLMSLAASPVIGSTMTFDAAFSRGLFIEFPASHVGRYTITYR